MLRFSDKTAARQAAIDAGVPVVPGSDGALKNAQEVVEFVEGIGLPVILKVCITWSLTVYYSKNEDMLSSQTV